MAIITPVPWLPSPVDLGFPAHFQSWRDDQLRAVDKVLGSTHRFVALTMPTGGGKSLTYVAAALLQKAVKRALILTGTKGLQDQLDRDFRELGLRDMRGQSNYPCHALVRGGSLDRYRRSDHQHQCDEGPCHAGVRCSYAPDRNTPEIRPGCDYYGAVYDATGASLVVSNYAYWLNAGAHSKGIGQFECLILDEAHEADKELEAFLTFAISERDVKRANSRMMDSSDVGDWKVWAQGHVQSMTRTLEQREAIPPQNAEGVREIRELKRTLTKFMRLSKVDVDSWIVDLESGVPVFTPIRVAAFADELLFRGIPRVILTSATLTAKTVAMLGIKSDDVTMWECPSSFALERRPIIHVSPQPEIRVSHTMHESHKLFWRRRIDRLIEPRLDRKGIIHTVSYARMQDLLKNSEWKDFFITHDSGNSLAAVAKFKASDAPCILLSPSIMTGFDFANDDARWQIIAKVPLLDIRGIAIQSRMSHDPDYAYYIAMQKLVQACGRIVRTPQDWGETFIVDDHFSWFVKRAAKFAPKWFLEAVDWSASLPPVLDPDTLAPITA